MFAMWGATISKQNLSSNLKRHETETNKKVGGDSCTPGWDEGDEEDDERYVPKEAPEVDETQPPALPRVRPSQLRGTIICISPQTSCYTKALPGDYNAILKMYGHSSINALEKRKVWVSK